MQNEDRIRALFADLGKSTLRGLRKCPNCGIFNGTRGQSCKNKACGLLFRVPYDKFKHSTEACKLNTGTTTQIFSVRVREKGPESRGFVQLPLAVATSSSSNTFIPQVSALCFVESCQRLFQSNILKCHDNTEPLAQCSHIQAAMRCFVNAHPLTIEENILSSLDINKEIKEELLKLLSETPVPFVQRVSKVTFAVKCKVTTKHPLGFIHVTFNTNKYDFTCPCLPKSAKLSPLNERKCLHYYACMAAFCCDVKLTGEFSLFPEINRHLMECALEFSPHVVDVNYEGSLTDILESTGIVVTDSTSSPGETPSLDTTDPTQFLDKGLMLPEDISQLDKAIGGELVEGESSFSLATFLPNPQHIPSKHKILSTRKDCEKGSKNEAKRSRKHTFKFSGDVSEKLAPESVSQSFIEWLSSVTERINQTMHFQFSGKPEPLVFHVPHLFFDCLVERMLAAGPRRKRLPNRVTRFIRRHSPPIGSFTNYTWHITNILQAKAIFDTPRMALNVTRSFIETGEGTYDDFNPAEPGVEYTQAQGQAKIRPNEVKTYLKIGKTAPDQVRPSILFIDWTPDVLPISKIGELKITFEYGHTPQVPQDLQHQSL